MISNNTGTEKLGEGDNDSTTSEEDNTKVLVVAEQTSMSSEMKPEKKQIEERHVQQKMAGNRRISTIFKRI